MNIYCGWTKFNAKYKRQMSQAVSKVCFLIAKGLKR